MQRRRGVPCHTALGGPQQVPYPGIEAFAVTLMRAMPKGVSDNLRNARVVYDKFNFIQNVVEECDQVRKAESRGDAGKRDRLEQMRLM
jgi:hypothetical protein